MTLAVPACTYRLQISADLDLHEAARVLPYLHDLGVDWVYLSPLLAAEPGSAHGYDVVAFDHVDESRGGAQGLAAISAQARRLGMGVLVDIVPNHVGVATPVQNAWWWDVLRLGRGSAHAEAFDIDWDAGNGRLLLPVLGDDDVPFDEGPIGHLAVADDELVYHETRFPLAPGTADDLGRDGVDATTVHARQHYELIGWRRADTELNYRRFFSVNSLAGVRVEETEVFAATHAEIGRWFAEDLVDGLRVDHPDGLRDPRGYLDDLARLSGGAYVLVEKILEPGEELPSSWATAGTTGYDVLSLLDRVLTDPAGQQRLDALETRLRGAPLDWEQLVLHRKRIIAREVLRAETNRIVRELPVISDASTGVLQDAVAEALACFGVYRSYLPKGLSYLEEAVTRAQQNRPDLHLVMDQLAGVLADPAEPAALRFQQTSGMVMAKGVEDNAFYLSSRLTSLNEVGADPSIFAVTPADFHRAMTLRQQEWPHAMTTLTTHDTKRGEDVRARIAVLAELPEVWDQTLTELLDLTPVPDPGFGSLLWQAILGAWPAAVDGSPPADLRERLHAYAEKAMREAGDRTTWTDPDTAYEAAVHAVVDAVFDDPSTASTLRSLVALVAAPGWSNALAAKLVAITLPGVCDVYQGSELWEQSLVDPDNRRPVDFARRAELLEHLDATQEPPALSTSPQDAGAAKLWVTRTALRLRRDRHELFSSYTPVQVEGPAADHVLAFDRGGAVTVVTRLPHGLAARGGWGETALVLPEGRWHDVLAGAGDGFPGDEPKPPLHTPRTVCEEAGSPLNLGNRQRVRMADLMTELPVALLVRER